MATSDIIKRVKTGIPGLDDICGGGIPQKSLLVVSGDPGSGKTIMSLEYLYMGATKYDEPGIFISLEEAQDDLLLTARTFGWDYKKMIEKKKLDIVSIDLYDFDQLKNIIEDSINRLKAKRVVIDPGVIFRLYFKDELDARKKILSLAKMLKASGCTTIVTNESMGEASSLFGLEEYVADGVLLLMHRKQKNKYVRSAAIVKMRDSKISEKMHPVKLSDKGIEILSRQEIFDD